MISLLSIISNFVLIAKNSSICEENKLSQVTLYYQFLQPNAAITRSDVMVTSQPWPQASLLPPTNEIWGKVIFSQTCVRLSTGRSAVSLGLCLGGGWSLFRWVCVQGMVSVQGAGLCPGGLCRRVSV